MIITTTSNLDGIKIKEYLGPIFAQSATGFSFLKDVSAMFRSVVGGRSTSHEEMVIKCRENALAELKSEARRIGANAIIGLSIDFDIIGGNNATNSLLLAKASATAVIIEN